jgi:hypothetical protein
VKQNLATTLMVIGVLLGPVVAVATEDSDADRSHPRAFVKYSGDDAQRRAMQRGNRRAIASIANFQRSIEAQCRECASRPRE